jgi:hypothetical protein
MKWMRPAISLKFWQHIAVDAFMEAAAKSYLRGPLLADLVRLGTTRVTVGYLLAACNLTTIRMSVDDFPKQYMQISDLYHEDHPWEYELQKRIQAVAKAAGFSEYVHLEWKGEVGHLIF